MTCFLTPDGGPFYGGTYYSESRDFSGCFGGFNTWRDRRGEVEEALEQTPRVARDLARRTARLAARHVALRRWTDAVAAGPANTTRHTAGSTAHRSFRRLRSRGAARKYGAPARRSVRGGLATHRHDGAGGIYDQLAGGFHRYTVDDAWEVPHFEKMLYDNALPAAWYTDWARRTGDPLARQVAAQTARFLLDDGRPDVFTSSLDADADGREGLTYVWTTAQLTEVLGADDGRWAAEVFGVTESGHVRTRHVGAAAAADPDDPQRLDRMRLRC